MSNSSSEEDKDERIIRSEQQLREINKDFKQIDNTIDKNHKLSEPIMQLQSQIMRRLIRRLILPTINKKKGKERSKNDKSKGNKS